MRIRKGQGANLSALTPVEKHGDIWMKRDDLFCVADVYGGKARTCWVLATSRPHNLLSGKETYGLVTAGNRQSPQINICAHIAKKLGVPFHAHTSEGDFSEELTDAQHAGAKIYQHRAGYNSVICARARADAMRMGWTEIPFGMECWEAVRQTRAQVSNLPRTLRRIVMPVGSGMSLAGVLWGMQDHKISVPVIGVVTGADPQKRLERYAPTGWRRTVTLVPSIPAYNTPSKITEVDSVRLDPIYEAKCIEHLMPKDLLWVVGIHRTSK